jgi:hypothetical protein
MRIQKNKFWNVEIIVGIMATIVSVCALVVSVTQTRIMREQQYAQVWPNLTYGVWKATTFDDETASFEFHLNNKGVGPAIIKDAKFLYDGLIYETDEIDKIFKKMLTDSTAVNFTYGSVGKNKVMLSGEDHIMWSFDRSKQAGKIVQSIWQSGGKFDLFICYQNIYGQKWIVHNGVETEECKSCEEMKKYLTLKKK